jgi:hypothetical protein
MKRMAILFLLATGSVLLAGCVEDELHSTTYHEHRPHLHTSTSHVTGQYNSYGPEVETASTGYQTGGAHHGHEPQPVVEPASSTGYQVE